MRQLIKPILGPDGQPLRRRESPHPGMMSHYDVAYTTELNEQHWSFTTSGDANSAFDITKRRKTRERARYETANSPYLRGMVETRASDTIGDGPILQMLTGDGQELERAWKAWSDEILLTDKLLTLWGYGKMVDGEGIALLTINEQVDHDVKLDLMLIEAEQMGNPTAAADTPSMYDGIRHDGGRPQRYYIYDEHPNASPYSARATYEGKWYDPWLVIHTYRRYRVGQLRGATELGPALPMSAHLRRYTSATISAAEVAAEISLWLETDGSPEDPPITYTGQNFDMFPMARNMVVTAPYGWHAKQIKSEQPVDTFESFLRCMVTQMGRSIGMPAALSFGDSSTYNMASGRLDFQTYIRSIKTDRRSQLEPCVLDKIFAAWLRFYASEKSGISPNDVSQEMLLKDYPHRWSYRPINHSDPEKQAAADIALYDKGLLTMDEFLYEQGKDPEAHREQLKEQARWLTENGLPLPGIQPGMEIANDTEDE